MKVYLGAPLHDPEDRAWSDNVAQVLRWDGIGVYSPHEHGVWEEMVDEAMQGYDSRAEAEHYVRGECFKGDILAMTQADIGVFTFNYGNRPQGPSEGMIWEMGFMYALHKPCYIIGDGHNSNSWDWNIMPEFGAAKIFASAQQLVKYLKTQEFI